MKVSTGVRDMILAIFFFSLMNLCVKYVSHIPAVEVVFFRSIVSLTISGVILLKQRVNLLGNNRKVLAIRGVTGTIALVAYFITLQKIPLAGAVTIHYLAPIFTSLLGVYIVKERVSSGQYLFFLLSFIGILVIQGVDTRITLGYALIGILGAIFTGLAYNMIRKLKTSEHPLVIIFYFPLVSIPITGLATIYDWVMPESWDWLFLLLVGILTQFGQFYLTKSYQSEELSKVSVISYIGIIFALAYGFLFFNEHYKFTAYLGMGLVLIGVVLNLWYKSRVRI
ncbi:MAG: membrane protein [Cyclobacteriaceae bacterium]|nr:MAG: membrane protein [Cyclobacteriaceae bacterium]